MPERDLSDLLSEAIAAIPQGKDTDIGLFYCDGIGDNPWYALAVNKCLVVQHRASQGANSAATDIPLPPPWKH